MNKIIITTQKELNALKIVEKDQEVYVEGYDLKLENTIEVFGFLKFSTRVDMAWGRHVVARGSSHVVARESSHVEARGSSHVEARESSHVVAWGSSHVEAWESSHVVARGSSHVEARESSHVVARGSSHVVARGSSHVEARESSHVEARESSASWVYDMRVEVNLFGWAVSYQLFEGKGKITKKHKTATVIKIPPMKATFTDYEARYPVEVKAKVATFYKAVHKREDGTYTSDYDRTFIYEIGKTYEHECAPASEGSCSKGLHVAHKSWARAFGMEWSNLAILECTVEIKDIVVSKDTDGKVRCKKIKVVREITKEEWF